MDRNVAKNSVQKNSGFTIIEIIIALLIITIVVMSFLSLTSHAAKSGNYVNKLSDLERMGSDKSMSLLKDISIELGKFTGTAKFTGSVAPEELVPGYYDHLDENGALISSPSQAIPTFIRQWKIIKDSPDVGDVTILVSVTYLGAGGKVTRIVKKTQTEFIN